MLRALILAGVASTMMGFAAPASAQQSITMDAVTEVCSRVAESERANELNSHPLRGLCLEATFEFVAGAIASSPVEDADAIFADLVIDLANIMLNDQCLLLSEIAEAIVFVSAAVVDPEQSEQIE